MRSLGALLLLLPLVAGCLGFHQGAMPGEPASAKFAQIDGVRVRFTDTGDAAVHNDGAAPQQEEKPTVVLIHGFASALDVWTGVVPALEKTHRVIALDLKGFGWTDRPEGDYSPDAQARLVQTLMDQRGVKTATIVAHSWGSSVALALALHSPERVSKIALYDAWIYEEQIPTFFHWSRQEGVGDALFALFYKERSDEKISLGFYDKKYVTQPFVDEVEAALDRPGTAAAALAAVRGQRYSEVEKRYRTIDKPTLLLWGREDIVTPIKYGERLSRDLPNASMIIYPRCGHFPMIEALNASNRDLVKFITKAEGT